MIQWDRETGNLGTWTDSIFMNFKIKSENTNIQLWEIRISKCCANYAPDCSCLSWRFPWLLRKLCNCAGVQRNCPTLQEAVRETGCLAAPKTMLPDNLRPRLPMKQTMIEINPPDCWSRNCFHNALQCDDGMLCRKQGPPGSEGCSVLSCFTG